MCSLKAAANAAYTGYGSPVNVVAERELTEYERGMKTLG